MRNRWLLNLALTALIVGLVALIYFKPGTDQPTGPSLTTLTTESITQLRIERTGRAPIALEKTDSRWRLNTPVRARANQFNVDSLLRVAGVTSVYQTPAESAELANYGLDKPTLQIHLDNDEIVVGATHPMRPQHYVRYRNTVHLIPSYVLPAAFLDYTSFIDTQLLEDERQLRALRLPALRLVNKDGTWQREPHDNKISADRLNEFVAQWQNARALSVERLSAKPAIDRIQLVLEIQGKRETLTLDILAYKPEFILARREEGLEYHFPEDVGKSLLTLSIE